MALARWWWGEPVQMFNELRKMQHEFARESAVPSMFGNVYPAVNIYDDGECFMIRAEVPGVDKSKLDISTKGGEVSIRGERSNHTAAGEAAFHRRERQMGVFHRVVTLPEHVDASKIQAAYREGVLEIVCPRAESAKSHKVQIG